MKSNFLVVGLIALLMAGPHLLMGQYSKLRLAFVYAEEVSQLDSAKLLVDQVVKHESTSLDPQAWYLRALVNKQLFAHRPWSKQSTDWVKESIQYSERSIQLDPTADNKKINSDLLVGLKFGLDKKLHEIGDTINFATTTAAVVLAQQLTSSINPKVKEDSTAIHYFLLLGEKSKQAAFYNKVLVLQPNNWFANYKIGEFYLQQLQLEGAQVFLERAYQTNAQNRKVLNALSKLYNQQGEIAKSAQFKQLAIDIGKD